MREAVKKTKLTENCSKETIREFCESGLAKYIEAVNALEVE